jgi:glutathione S-transferase
MILIGQYDSPFVRRVGITLRHYGRPFEHRPWSVFGDSEKIRPINPLVRVPTLVLDDGMALMDSHSMIDFLDGGAPAALRLSPVGEPERRQVLRVAALAMGAAEKAVSLFYETRLHSEPARVWVERCVGQMSGALDRLEAECGWGEADEHWFGSALSHADIAVTVSLRFIGEAHANLGLRGRWPRLEAGAARLETRGIFQEICQPFIPPA